MRMSLQHLLLLESHVPYGGVILKICDFGAPAAVLRVRDDEPYNALSQPLKRAGATSNSTHNACDSRRGLTCDPWIPEWWS